jgi:hypothetical protein
VKGHSITIGHILADFVATSIILLGTNLQRNGRSWRLAGYCKVTGIEHIYPRTKPPILEILHFLKRNFPDGEKKLANISGTNSDTKMNWYQNEA